MHVWQLFFFIPFSFLFFFYHVWQIKTIAWGRNNYCIYTLGRPLNLPQVMKIYGGCGYFFFLESPCTLPPTGGLGGTSLTAHPSLPPDSLHPTTLLSSPFGVAHLYGNNWSASPPALFKARFHHPPPLSLSVFFGVFFFINLQTLPRRHPTGLKMCEVRQRVSEREREELCYLSGIVISRASPSWLEFAPAEPSERLVALRWRGKGDFFFLCFLHRHINPLFTLNQFASLNLSHLIFIFFTFACFSGWFSVLSSFLTFNTTCLVIYRTVFLSTVKCIYKAALK